MKCKNCGSKVNKNIRFCGNCGSEISKRCKNKISKKARVIIAIVCCFTILVTGTIGGLYFKNSVENNSEEYGNYIMLNEGFTDVTVTDEKSALEAINTVKDVIGINDINKELKTQRVDKIDNTTYYRFQQYYNNIPVYGKSINLPVYADGQAAGLTSNFCALNTDLSTEATASQSDIEKTLKKQFDNQNIILEQLDASKLVYYITDDNNAVLAYELRSTVPGYIVFVDANSGKIIFSNSLFCDASAEVQSEEGQVSAIGWKNDDGSYHLYNDEYKISVFDVDGVQTSINAAGTLKDVNLKAYGIDTMYSENNMFSKESINALKIICSISEFYRNLNFCGFERLHVGINEIFGDGTNPRALGGNYDGVKAGIILIGNKFNYNNIDVLAHEYTHAVSGLLVGWNGVGYENSAINEAYSDIFGVLYENSKNPDWVLTSGNTTRDIADPNRYGYPIKKGDNNNSTEKEDHAYSTVISHSAYLMWNGINGTEKNKISADLLAELWYQSLYLLPSNATFSQCRNAVELSARIMMKNNELTMEQYMCVCNAFNEVGIERAEISYNYFVKNDFNLKVLGSKRAGDTKFNLDIYKLPENLFDLVFNANKKEILVSEEKDLTDSKIIHLDDGVYKLVISPVETNCGYAEPITVRIAIYNKVKNAKDEVAVFTEFDDLTTVVLNENPDELPEEAVGDYFIGPIAGDWGTKITINRDLTFSGFFINFCSDEIIICEFTGQFSNIEREDEYTYKMNLGSLTAKHPEGYTYEEEKIKHTCVAKPYGIDDGKEFYLYLKGRTTKNLPKKFLNWINIEHNENILLKNCIRNTQYDYGFIKCEDENNLPSDDLSKILTGTLWKNNIQDISEYRFTDDGKVYINGEYAYTYSLDGNTLMISGEEYTLTLKYVHKNDEIDWHQDEFFYNTQYVNLKDDEGFFYDTYYVSDEMGLSNVLWLREAKYIQSTLASENVNKQKTKNPIGSFYGNKTAEQIRKSIIGSWGALGSIVPEYNFLDSKNCSGEYPWQSSGTYSISDNKTLTISWAGKTEEEIYVWSSETWDEFYSHRENKGKKFWYMTDKGVLKLNGKEKYREGVNNFTYNSNGELMKDISGIWINKTQSTEYRIYDDGTWEESTVHVSSGHLISRTVLNNGYVEIVDETNAKLWQEVKHLNQIPGASELIYDDKTDKISVGGTHNTFTRAKYK